MKQIMKTFLLLLVFTIALAGCDGTSNQQVNIPAPTSSLTKTLALSGSGGTIDVPFASTGGGRRSMMLYTAAEMKGAGAIKSISFKYNSDLTTAVTCPNTTIKMSHTNLANLDGTQDAGNGIFANNVNTGQGSQQTVLTASTVNIPAGTAGTYYTITLSTPFYYNGVDNLVVDIAHDACSGTVWTTEHASSGALVTLENAGATATTGYTRAWRPDTQFNLSGGDSSIIYTVGVGPNVIPFGGTNKVQLLYTAAEINGSGIITGIGFPVGDSPTTSSSATVTVTLGHTSLTGLTATYANNFNIGTPVVVANAQTFTVPAGVPYGTYVWIPMPDGAFNYDGTDNLVVQIETSGILGGIHLIMGSGGTNTRLLGAPGDLTGTFDSGQHFIKFRFAGGTMDVITAGGDSNSFPFSSSLNTKSQYLYFAEELGTKGTITKVACRLAYSSNNSAYNSFNVVLGHTTSTSLGSGTFSGNMADAQTVFSGTFTVPAGLAAGDWIEIPLSTSFAYDGTRNLVVQLSSLAGTQDNNIIVSLDNTLYLKRRNYADDNTTDGVAGTENYLADLRLFMQ
jgi:hypothetical protein